MENADFFMGLAQQALWITALAAAPVLIPALIVGLLVATCLSETAPARTAAPAAEGIDSV